MGLFDKVKALTEKAAEVAQQTAQAAKETYGKEGAEGIGKILGQTTKKAIDSVVEYAEDVGQAANKTANKSALIYNEKQKTSQDVTRAILATVGAGRKITMDVVDAAKKAADSFENLDKPQEQESDAPKKPKLK